MQYLSPHFTFDELTVTSHKDLETVNEARAMAYLPALQATAALLELVRSHFGGRPMTVHSGYRSPELNAAIGGAEHSQHMAGEAADFHIAGVELQAIFDFVRHQTAWKWGQVILEGHSPDHPSWVHLSTGSRCEALTFDGKRYHTAPG